jgi:hypothetical protein
MGRDYILVGWCLRQVIRRFERERRAGGKQKEAIRSKSKGKKVSREVSTG